MNNQGAEQEVENWDIVVESKTPWFNLQLKHVWHYRDLLFLLVKRDYVASFKQTVLGPLWFFIQPLMTTFVYIFIFGRVAKISTGSTPGILFYFMNVVLWNYFASCLLSASNTFVGNANLFGKVYFPRLIIPMSSIFSNLLKFGVQFAMFILMMAYYYFAQPGSIHPTWSVLFFPFILLAMAMLGSGVGMIISSMTTKYRDLNHLVAFGVQLFMYATPVVYPLSFLKNGAGMLLMINPLTSLFELYRYMFLGEGSFNAMGLAYSFGFAAVAMAIGVIVFNRVEKSFIDTV
ncbi:MAG: ABC transporter permease [Flavobacteriales bacterium]